MKSTVVASAHQVSSELEGEIIILDLVSGVYHGLGSVGARAWSMIQQPASVGTVRDQIMAEYDVGLARCESDLLALLGELNDKGLIECRDTRCAGRED